jgi:gliding motility-associated-like protein
MIPNAFSPNGDGINDTWQIEYLESYPGTTVDIFNRYGQKVFSSVGYTKPWDGKYNGKVLPVGTYYYVINPKNGRSTMSGSVTIIL